MINMRQADFSKNSMNTAIHYNKNTNILND